MAGSVGELRCWVWVDTLLDQLVSATHHSSAVCSPPRHQHGGMSNQQTADAELVH
jgi:hypothetical protein